jgi:hypothetical protein
VDPHNPYTEAGLAAATSVLGALVSFLQRLRAGEQWSILWFGTHMATAAFAGLMCWLLAQEQAMSGPMTGLLTGMAGYSGGKAIEYLEARLKREVGA